MKPRPRLEIGAMGIARWRSHLEGDRRAARRPVVLVRSAFIQSLATETLSGRDPAVCHTAYAQLLLYGTVCELGEGA